MKTFRYCKIFLNLNISNYLLFNFLLSFDLPHDFPGFTISISDPEIEGNLYFSTYEGTGQSTKGYLGILSKSGSPIYFKKVSGARAHDFKPHSNGMLSFIRVDHTSHREIILMDSTYTIIDTIVPPEYGLDGHEFQILENGNYIFLARATRILDLSHFGGSPAAQVVDLLIQEIDSSGELVFEWNTADYFDIQDAPHIDITAPIIDYAHSNSLHVDTDSTIILSSRNLDEITKINRNNGNIIWRFGGVNNQFTFTNDSNDENEHSIASPFCWQHDARILANGNLTFFDNGSNKTPRRSRLVEYELDEENLIATLVWSYTDDLYQYGYIMGNHQRLSNDNSIGVWNNKYNNTAIIEVAQDSTKVFELIFENTYDQINRKIGIYNYRAFRYDWEGRAIKPHLWLSNASTPLRLNFSQFGDSTIEKYFIYQGLEVNNLNKVDSTDNEFYDFSNFGIEELHYFAITSKNNFGLESQFSNIESYLPLSVNVEYKATSPNEYLLHQNYPNPFNPITRIDYFLPKKSNVELTIFDLNGKKVKELVNEIQGAGIKSVYWSGEDFKFGLVSSGLYIYVLKVEKFRISKKMAFIK